MTWKNRRRRTRYKCHKGVRCQWPEVQALHPHHFLRSNWSSCSETDPSTLKSSTLHTSCCHRSSAVKKTSSRADCEMSPSHWWMADSLKERRSCSIVSGKSAPIPQSFMILLFIPFFYFFISSCRHHHDMSSHGQFAGLHVAFLCIIVSEMWNKIHFTLQQMGQFIFLGLKWQNQT